MAIHSLCSPTPELACFACCPPLRPPGYDHLDYRSSLTRLLSENRGAFLAGHRPSRVIQGFWCPGLGFLDPAGRRVGCLLHPAANQGRDLRGPTGYRDKCHRESCAEARAFDQLAQPPRTRLMELCAAMDSFVFSSRRANPVMRLLALGPATAAAAAELPGLSLAELTAWPWLSRVDPALGWLIGRLVAETGPELLRRPELHGDLQRLVHRLRRALGPRPPLEQGQPLHQVMADQWQARFWRYVLKRNRALAGQTQTWQAALAAACQHFPA